MSFAFALTAACSARGETADYLERCVFYSDGRVTRFDHSPITIHLGPLPSGMDESDYDASFRRAAELWSKKTDGLIELRFVESSADDIDIPVKWVTRVPNASVENHLARTILARPNPSEARVRMEIGVYDQRSGKRLTADEMLTVCLHELGHAFGLWGHSDVADDIMSQASEATEPTDRDVATLRALYALPMNAPLHDKALPLLREQVADNPNSAYTRYLLGSVSLDAKDFNAAIDQFIRALELDAGHQDAAEKLVLAYLSAGRSSEAMQRMADGAESSPEFYNNTAIALAEQGKDVEAIRAFERALEIDPNLDVARRNLARLYARKGNAARESADYSAARAAYEKAWTLDESESNYGIQLGVTLNRLDHDADAASVYERVLAEFPDLAVVRDNLAKTYNNLGVDAIKASDWKTAQRYFDQALTHQPDFETALTNRKSAQWQWAVSLEASNPSESVARFREFLVAAPESWEAHARIGLIYSKAKDYAQALKSYEEAYRLNPARADTRHNLAVAHHQYGAQRENAGMHEEAIASFLRALEVDPEFVGSYKSLAVVYRNAGRMDEAAAALEDALRREPNDEWAQQAMANLALAAGNDAFQQGDYRAALREFERAPEAARSGPVYAMLGFLYTETEQFDLAVDALGRALLANPEDKTSRQNLDVSLKEIKKLRKTDESPKWALALTRLEAYRLASLIGRAVKKRELSKFEELLVAQTEDVVTVAALQDCALFIANLAAEAEPDRTRQIALKALTLNEEHEALQALVNQAPPAN